MESSRRSGKTERADSVTSVGARDPGRDDIDEAVHHALQQLPGQAVVVVAFSGGVDSMVLLDALSLQWPAQQLVAWHVHHGLQQHADRWASLCEQEAVRLGVRFGVTRIDACLARGNVEGWARKARYDALWNAVAENNAAALFTAHQADDQLETVIMRIARGSGPEALGGMAPAQRRKGGLLLRPLLSIGRERVVERARMRTLQWIDDPMNVDDRFLRVALRMRVLPELARSTPSLRENVLRSAQLLRESGETLCWLAAKDLREAGLSPDGRAIERAGLVRLPPQRRDRAVRMWFDLLETTMPNRPRLEQWIAQMLLGRSASAELLHEGWRFRRYRERIEVAPLAQTVNENRPLMLRWRGERAIGVAGWRGSLHFETSNAPGAVDAHWLAGQTLELRAPRSGSRLRPHAGGPSRTLKNLFQERGVPPWLRGATPALYVGDRLLFVAGLGMDRSANGVAGSHRVVVSWHPDDPRDPGAGDGESGPPV